MFKIMLDTETVTCALNDTNDFSFYPLPYQIALHAFCDDWNVTYGSQVYFIKESLEYIRDCKDLDYIPQYAPNWLMDNLDYYLNNSLSAKRVLSVLTRLYTKYPTSFVAHNAPFDISALDNLAHFVNCTAIHLTQDKKPKRVLSYFDNFTVMECMAYYPCAMDYKHAKKVPNSPKGYATLKMDYLSPLLLKKKQTHDALADCKNQAEIFCIMRELANGISSAGTVFQLMRLYHSLHSVPLFTGTFTLKDNKDKPRALILKK